MLVANIPTLIAVPFANSAGGGYINPIPVPTQIVAGVDNALASMTDGFTPVTFQPTTAGGIPPRGQDFNGILNLVTSVGRWQQAGAGYPYNAAFSASIGGYPNGSIIQRSDYTGGWISIVDGNTTNPDAGGAGWIPYGGSTSILGVTLGASSITLTALQAASPIIILTGTLSANVNLVLPAWVSAQWMVINQCTGAFSVTVKTPTGTGVVVAASSNLYCSSTGINTSTLSSGTVTSVSVINANGVSASVANPTTSPAMTFTLGNITPQSVVATNAIQAASFNRTSDRRLKKRIKRLRLSAKAADAIRLYSWEWRAKAGHAETHGTGVLADEVEQVFPSCVTINAAGYKTVDYGLLAVHLMLAGR